MACGIGWKDPSPQSGLVFVATSTGTPIASDDAKDVGTCALDALPENLWTYKTIFSFDDPSIEKKITDEEMKEESHVY